MSVIAHKQTIKETNVIQIGTPRHEYKTRDETKGGGDKLQLPFQLVWEAGAVV